MNEVQNLYKYMNKINLTKLKNISIITIIIFNIILFKEARTQK